MMFFFSLFLRQEKNTALHIAVENDRSETVEQLLRYGAQQTLVNKVS